MSDIDAAVDGWFETNTKPGATGRSRAVFDVVRERIEQEGACSIGVKGQVSFTATRGFCWVWLYNVTQRSPDGTLHLQLAIGERMGEAHVRSIDQVSAKRWNHQVVLRTVAQARSRWLGTLLAAARAYGDG